MQQIINREEFRGGIFVEQSCSLTINKFVFHQYSTKSCISGYICR